MVRSPFQVKPRELITEIKDELFEAWSFKNSFFADYKNDNYEILTLCFEMDW